MEKPITDLDVIFISYDEPNADAHWANLLEICPWAKRVHGVEGSDAAHKAAAQLSDTDRFIGIDADNIVDPRFFDQLIDFDSAKFKDKVVSWSAKNHINGLEYGNGGLKCWPVEYVMNMKTHEHAEDAASKIDFCWSDSYVQMNNRFCTTYQNGSPLQAFRSGFREGVKMSLDRGLKVPSAQLEEKIWWGNYHRLLIWLSVGADVENGNWAIYGARLGCYMTNLTDWNHENVQSFAWINNFWKTEILPKVGHDDVFVNSEIYRLGTELKKHLGLVCPYLDSEASKFFKKTYVGLPRTGKYLTEEELDALRKINK